MEEERVVDPNQRVHRVDIGSEVERRLRHSDRHQAGRFEPAERVRAVGREQCCTHPGVDVERVPVPGVHQRAVALSIARNEPADQRRPASGAWAAVHAGGLGRNPHPDMSLPHELWIQEGPAGVAVAPCAHVEPLDHHDAAEASGIDGSADHHPRSECSGAVGHGLPPPVGRSFTDEHVGCGFSLDEVLSLGVSRGAEVLLRGIRQTSPAFHGTEHRHRFDHVCRVSLLVQFMFVRPCGENS